MDKATKTTVITVPEKAVSAKPRREFREDSWTAEQVAARKLELTVEEIPDGWIKLADFSKKLRSLEIPISRLVRAIGGDRGMKSPAHPLFRIVYCKGARWLSPAVLTEGVQLLTDPKFAAVPRKPRVKKEKTISPAAAKKLAATLAA